MARKKARAESAPESATGLKVAAPSRAPDKPHKRNLKANKGLELARMADLSDRGLTDTEVARVLQCSRENVTRRLNQYEADKPMIDFFDKHEVSLIKKLKQNLIDSITAEEIKRMHVRDRVVCYGILTDKAQSLTGNNVLQIDIRMIHGDLAEIQRQKAEIMARLQDKPALNPSPELEHSQ